MNTRRKILTLGSLVAAGGLSRSLYRGNLPETSSSTATKHEAWQQQLAGLADWVVWKNAEDGALEAHCGVADARTWAGMGRKIAGGERLKMKAAGNVLSFEKAGQPVRVIIHPLDAVV